ncbi:hypothetical protein M409DRAFT_67128 [Zasmidium cellare ATCC 36951]|uniref:AMP-dependent synthetase/ligase domain-containing protein n=1 Tax=Zasmidium cellare ATCC 36951 TaxID=1080233 RepID=A0A6A6CFG1_ZASCE|nr:uncharacterized protein M409DRAFT_67128 [Zasmidium cellare ATCC 36951]KAF2165801.1 hypothetical protein M409DRAFT_67128 [Zasmidium cellare ATCC 36951]
MNALSRGKLIPTIDILSYYFDEPQFDQNKPLYIDALDPERFWTAAQCHKAIRQLAAGFKAAGLSQGDCVSIHSFNDINYSVLVNGIAGFGGVYTGTNPAYQTYELVHHLKASKARLIVVAPELLDAITAAAQRVKISNDRILIFDDQGQKGYKSWRSLFDHGEIDWPHFDNLETSKDTVLARLFSSGTTGLPKAAQLSHYNLIAEHRLFTEWNPTTWERRRIVILPMFHAATAPLAHYASLRSGDECYVVKKFDLETFFKVVEKYQITEGAFVPPVIHAIVNSPLSKKYSLKSIRIGHAGAAPVDKWSQSKLKALMAPDAPLTQVWGMTETSCTCSMSRYPLDDATGSVGNMLPNMDSKLVDEDGNDISGYDRRGELCVRGPLVCQGYFDNPEANARDWDSDGFFHTGDIAYRDGKSKLWYIVDRKKELIKVRANQVSPSELEAVLLQHLKIGDTAVIGMPSKDFGETPLAYVVKRPDVELTEAEVKKYIIERLAKYKQLGGVVFIDALPRSASGKLLKRILREEMMKTVNAEAKPRL